MFYGDHQRSKILLAASAYPHQSELAQVVCYRKTWQWGKGILCTCPCNMTWYKIASSDSSCKIWDWVKIVTPVLQSATCEYCFNIQFDYQTNKYTCNTITWYVDINLNSFKDRFLLMYALRRQLSQWTECGIQLFGRQLFFLLLINSTILRE